MKKVWVKTIDGTEFGQISLDELLDIISELGVDIDIDRNVATVYCDADELEEGVYQ